MVLEALVWVDDSRWPPESEGPSTVLLRHTDTYAEGRSWVVLGSTPDDNIRNR